MRYYDILNNQIIHTCNVCNTTCTRGHVEMPPRVTGTARMQHYCPSCYKAWEKSIADGMLSKREAVAV